MLTPQRRKRSKSLKIQKIEALSKAQRELFDKLLATDLAFLHGIPGRSGPVFTISVAVVGFVASAAVLGVGKWLQIEPIWAKAIAVVLLLAVLLSLVMAVWAGLDCIRPSDFDLTPARQDFIDLTLPLIPDENIDLHVNAFMAELTRTEIVKNKEWIEKRMRRLGQAVKWLRFAFVMAILLVAISVIIAISLPEQESADRQQQLINKPAAPAGTRSSDSATPDTNRAAAGNGYAGGRSSGAPIGSSIPKNPSGLRN